MHYRNHGAGTAVAEKNKRKIYLVNPKFQLKFSLFMCVLITLVCLMYPLVIYDIMMRFAAFTKLCKGIEVDLGELSTSTIIILAIWQIGFTALVFIISIFESHKIAGPLYKLDQALKAVKERRPFTRIQFRKGDHFQDLATNFNEAFLTIHEKYHNDFAQLDEVVSYINNLAMVVPPDKKAVLHEISEKLREIQSRYNVR